MAVIAEAITPIRTWGDRAHIISWTPLANGDSGSPIEMPGSADRSIQISGTFGAGGTIVFEGSNDGTNYVTLTDPQGNAISKTAASIEAVTELTRYVRPRVTAGDGTTALTATLIVRRIL
jgi:hypothetical protein